MARAKKTVPWFSELGLIYARHFAEVEPTRESYGNERTLILDALAQRLENELKGRGSAIEGKEPKAPGSDCDYRSFTVGDSRYGEASKVKHAAGVSVSIESEDAAPVRLYGSVGFRMSERRFDSMSLARRSPPFALDAQTAWYWEKGYAWLDVKLIPIEDPQRSDAERSTILAELPTLICDRLAGADAWLAEIHASVG